ncbi:MAG: GNAT family N-acetyltransferase [Nocardioidaceae bacterium]
MTITAGRTDLLVTTRPTNDNDAVFLFELYASTREDGLAATGWSAFSGLASVHMQAHAEDDQLDSSHPDLDRQTVYVDSVRAGRILVDRTCTSMRLVDLSLLPQWRGHGIGTQLLAELLSEAKAANLPVHLEVVKTNPSIRLYERLGFGDLVDCGMRWRLTWTPPSHKRVTWDFNGPCN